MISEREVFSRTEATESLGDYSITIMEQEGSPSPKTNTNNHHQEVGYNARRLNLKNFTKEHSDRRFHSMSRSVSGGKCGPGLLPGNRANIQTSNIVNRALEVMSKSLKETDYIPQKPVKSTDDADTEDESETAHSPSDSSNSDNDIEASPQPAEPKSRLGSVTAQLSFRKIAKKRRKAGGRSSFHYSKSSKEDLRKAQEAYQRLKISEQEQQRDQQRQPELESGRDRVVSNKDTSSSKTKESKAIDYGYGDASDKKTKDEVDYGYGDSSASQPNQTVDYGYGDATGGKPQLFRRGKPKRRNSVTKYSVQAANVVAAQAAAERILKLRPSLTSLSRSSTTPTRRRQQQDQPQRLNTKQVPDVRRDARNDVRARRTGNIATMQTTLQRQHQRLKRQEDNEQQIAEKKDVDRLEPPLRSSSFRRQRSASRDRGSVMQSPRLQVTSDYFSSDPKPKNLVQRNSGRVNGTTFRFSAPARTSSWLSNDTMNKTDDDDDCDSLASDMESLCSIRDNSYRSDTHSNALKNTDMPPVLPSPDRRSRFAGGRSISGDLIRRPLVVSWSNGSNKDGALSRFAREKSRPRRERSGSNDFAILPSVPARFVATNGSKSKSCMPAPVRRTPSYKGPQQRQD